MNKEFLERVQQHERTWGSEKYPNRPELIEIMSAPVVAFWVLTPKKPQTAAEARFVISVHSDLKEIESWYLQAVTRLHLQLPDRRLVAAYQQQNKVRIKGVKILFEVVESE